MPRKQHTYHYIYKTTCKITGKYYVGMHSTSNLEDGYIGSGKRLWLSIKKHGRENHEIEILEWFPDRSSLKNRERELVNESLLQDPMCMNLKLGGEGGFTFESRSKGGKIANQKFFSRMQNEPGFSDKVIDNIKKRHFEKTGSANGWKGRKHSPETIEKFRIIRSQNSNGEKNSQFGTVWIFDPLKNKAEKISNTDLERKLQEGCRRGRK